MASPRVVDYPDPLNPGAVTASDGFVWDHDEQPDPVALYRVFGVTVDARNSTQDVTITRGKQTQVVKAGAADKFQPGGWFDFFRLSVPVDVADGEIQLIYHMVHHEDAAPQGAGTRSF